MKSKVIQIPDLSGFHGDPEYTKVVVSEEEIRDRVLHLAKEHGDMIELEEAAENCGVICENQEGKKVLLYPSLGIPGAVQAERDVQRRKVGDTFAAVIAGTEMCLTVKKILLYKTCEMDDTLAAKCQIEGVRTLDQLKKHIEQEIADKKHQENVRMLVMQMQDYLCANAQLAFDEEEVAAWTGEQARISYEENLEMGIDLRFTEDGEMLTEEEVLQQLAEEMKGVFASMLVSIKFCEERGFTTDKEGIEAENECYPFVYEELSKLAEEMIG